MLQITRSMKALKGDLRSAHNLCSDIIGVLRDVNDQTNLTKEIGIFVRQMPDYKVLTKDADAAKQFLRKICSGEIEPEEAWRKLVNVKSECEMLLTMLESTKLLSDS